MQGLGTYVPIWLMLASLALPAAATLSIEREREGLHQKRFTCNVNRVIQTNGVLHSFLEKGVNYGFFG